MFDVLKKEQLAGNVYRLVIHAPRIATKRAVGQFVVVRASERGERVPLTIAQADPVALTITIVVQAVGSSTKALAAMERGDSVPDIAGPLGRPTEIHHYDHAVAIGGGVGIALIWPIAEALSKHCKKVTGIISARSADALILREDMEQLCTELKVATDDGSLGYHGFPTDLLKQMLEGEEKVDAVYAVGPVPMMAAVANTTRPFGVKTIVSLNPIMVDGTGMCGGCRVSVGGETKFACVDGPEFDGHLVDFRELSQRLRQYGDDPKARLLPRYESAHACDERHTSLQNAMLEAGQAAKKATEIPRQPMPEQPADGPRAQLRGGALRPAVRAGADGGPPLPAVQEAPVRRGLPGRHRHPRLHPPHRRGRLPGRRPQAQGGQHAAGRLRPRLPAGDAVRGALRGRPARRAGGHRQPGAVRRRLRAGAGQDRGARHAARRAGVKVAVIGSGPAGLTAAGELARRGYSPTIFEALHEPGGVLLYGIPSFRLPKEIVHKEIDLLRQMGVEIVCDFVVGKTATIQELMEEGYAGVFIGTGAGTPILAGVPGENLNGVLSANEYLTRVNLMRGYRADYATPVMVKDRVAVLGGGNVAMDSARVALRLGAKEVTIVYRRSVEESPARVAERHHAEEEGIRFEWLTNAVEIQGDEKGWVSGLRCIKMELGEPGADGRRRPIPIEGSEFDMPMDLVIVAFGNRPHPLVPQSTPGLEIAKWGGIVTEEATGATCLPGVYAGGDIVTGAATVIQAMGAGKTAAASMDAVPFGPIVTCWLRSSPAVK